MRKVVLRDLLSPGQFIDPLEALSATGRALTLVTEADVARRCGYEMVVVVPEDSSYAIEMVEIIDGYINRAASWIGSFAVEARPTPAACLQECEGGH